MIEKTNVMRLLNQALIGYRAASYPYDESDLSGVHAAQEIGMPPDQVFKTLVARGERRGILIFCIPCCCSLDLRKAAHAAGEKKIAMVHMKELPGLTGYIRGGCSPIGMKKSYPVFLDESAQLFDEISISAGQRGVTVLLDPMQLASYVSAEMTDLTENSV